MKPQATSFVSNPKPRVLTGFSRLHLGFTLYELMIVVAITGVLAAIAIPSYSSYVQKARRSDAITQLMSLAQAMERQFTTNGQYDVDGLNETTVEGEACYYQFTYGVTRNTFTITAQPYNNDTTNCGGVDNGSKSSQRADTDCRAISINQALSLSSTDADGESSTSLCIRS